MRTVKFPDSVKPLLTSIDNVQQFPDNPNSGDLDEIITSIQINGFNTAITADVDTGYILAGNHRYQALHALGATQIPVIWVEKPLDGGKRFLIADNAVGQLARMDDAMLADILKDLNESEVGLIGTGYDDERFQSLLADLSTGAGIPMGEGLGVAPSGIFQVVIEFEDEEERDEAMAVLADQYEDNVRSVNL